MQIKFDANKKRLDTTPVFGLLVQGENLAESIQITGPKMVGALDLSQLRVAVRMTSAEYETTVEKTLEQTTDGDTITLIWEVDKQFTGSPGKVDVMLVGYGGNEEVIKITSSGMVVQEDKVFGTAPPESTWEQILQQMQDFATQAYESKTAAADSAAAAAASQKVAEEKAAQATNAADTAVAAAKTAAKDAAAQAAAKTEQQIRQYADDRYARPLVTKTGPAASLEVYPDKLSNLKVYANGFTTQAGTGDPSPTNVRALTNGGLNLVELVLTGSEDISDGTNLGSVTRVIIKPGILAPSDYSIVYCTDFKRIDGWSNNSPHVYVLTYPYMFVPNEYLQSSGAGGVKAWLAARYAAGNPVIVWYQPADESQATGLYAPIILTSGEYRATCLPLTAPLCEGDSVVSWAKSGCDKVMTFDGSEDEGWVADSASGTGPSGSKRMYAKLGFNVPNGNGAVKSAAYFNYLVNVTNNSLYTGQQDNVGAVMQSSSLGTGAVYVRIAGISTVEALKQYLAANPLTVWYRSTSYTEADDIPVSLETHQKAALVLDGTENAILASGGHMQVKFPASAQAPVGGADSSNVCSHAKFVYSASGNGFYVLKPDASVIFGSAYVQAAGWSSAEDCKAYLATQYAAGTPVTIVYQLATPITYAHEAVVLPALPDDTGKVTITGQSGGTVTVVFNKSIIKEIAEIKAAMLAMGANLSM